MIITDPYLALLNVRFIPMWNTFKNIVSTYLFPEILQCLICYKSVDT